MTRSLAKALTSNASFQDLFITHSSPSEVAKLPIVELDKVIQLHEKNSKQLKKSPFWVDVKSVDETIKGKEDVVGKTQIDVISQDMAFVVDSVTAELSRRGFLVGFLLHPIIEIVKPTKTWTHNVHIHIRISNSLPKAECQKLKTVLEDILADIRLANDDWPMMKNMIRSCQKGLNNAPNTVYEEDLIEDNLEFLEYLYRNNFTILGYREYKFSTKDDGAYKSTTVRNSGLGLLRNERMPVFLNKKDVALPAHLQAMRKELPPIYVSKINKLSTVHRSVPLDCINIKLFNEKGELTGEGCFVGLFTSVTYNQSLRAIPFLRYKADQVSKRAGYAPNSHMDRVLKHILEKYPRDELFQIGLEQLQDFCEKLVDVQDYKRIALFVRKDPFQRYVSCLIYVPKERWDTRLRITFQRILEKRLQGTVSDYTISIDDSPLARLSFVISVDDFNLQDYDCDLLEQELIEAAQKWTDRLQTVLFEEEGDSQSAFALFTKYSQAFSGGYEKRYTPLESYRDILKIEEVFQNNSLTLDLIREGFSCGKDLENPDSCTLHLKFYNLGKSVDLSSVFPIIENMGFYVVSEIPSEVRLDDGQVVWIQHFILRAHGLVLDQNEFALRKALFEESFLNTYLGVTENDQLNQLSLKEGLSGRDIVIVRTVLRYLRQTDYNYSKTFTEQVVTENSHIAALLVKLFTVSHDPHFSGDRTRAITDTDKALKKALKVVKSIDHDAILRLFWEVIRGVLRTNFYQGKEYTSIKLDSSQISSLPDPKPYREIFVYSRRVEGVHLRGDAISRGGLRWSDRPEDFRTEVLGLMKAQMVKNAVIVPMGAKGGFVVKNPPLGGDRQALFDEGVECYKTFIRGLLDITDNVDNQKIIPPKNVVRLDSDDPYLVVAADKGTATFSDIANGISEEYGFWLGDAFASGGSVGYDHKVMGITARGAWESVKRHFRELDHDSQTQDFDAIGVGDMGGDVFGNGMLLSKHIRLVGAFNHLHIFCDPNPDVATSWKERKRLFDAVKGWDHYDESLLSKGGRIYSRFDKKLKLTKAIQTRFGLADNEVSPNELMKAMLKAETDLLWFGGIGTYIKAKNESHEDVSDKANDAIRINAKDVNAKVIGEGANLGVTQEGRIALSVRDVKVNADFIDNAGGVNSSDVEVNIKILLNKLTRGKKPALTVPARNKLLASMTKDVEDLVLSNNYQQAQAISLMSMYASSSLLNHADYIRSLEEKGLLDREIEFLPSDEEIDNRLKDGVGLRRPELSVLQCYAKNILTKDILATDLPDLALNEHFLLDYFPSVLVKSYKQEILKHQLCREIIATEFANSIVNRFGPTFVDRIMKNTAAPLDTILKSYMVIHKAFNLSTLWDRLEGLDGTVSPHVQMKAMGDVVKVIERQVIWLTKRMGKKIDPLEQVPAFTKAVTALSKDLESLLPESRLNRLKDIVEQYTAEGVPEEIAREIAALSPMSAVGNVITTATQRNIPIKDMAHVYYMIGDHFHIYWLRLQSRHLFVSGLWSGQALREIRSKLYMSQAKIAERYISDFKGKKLKITSEMIKDWCEEQGIPSNQALSTVTEMRDAQKIDLSMLIVAEQLLAALYDA